MDGVLVVIDRLGRALAQAENDLAKFAEENERLRTENEQLKSAAPVQE